MGFRAIAYRIRWALFVGYVFVLLTVPFVLLWDAIGLCIGTTLTLLFFFVLGRRGTQVVSRRLQTQEMALAQAPQLFAIVKEYCRRLQIPLPTVGVIETPALNVAVYGFSRKDYHLVVTRGLLTSLTREQLCAVLGRQLSYLWFNDVFGDTWLSRYLSALDALVMPAKHRNHPHPTRRFYPFKALVRQLLIYPLTILPVLLLKSRRDPRTVDLKSVRVTRKPRALGEGLRLLEAYQERIPFHVPFSARHLFLLPPPTLDPVARVLFETSGFADRVTAIAQLNRTVTMS